MSTLNRWTGTEWEEVGVPAAAPSTVTALDFPGAPYNYASTPDSVATSITSDIDIRIKLALDDWTPAALQGLVSKWSFTSGNRSYQWYVLTDGTLQFDLSADGSASGGAVSSVATGFTDGTTHWLRVTWNNTTNVVQFFTSNDGASWTQLGTDQSINLAGIFDGTASLMVGALNGGGAWFSGGIFYYAEVRAGIGGTVAAKFDPSAVVILGTRNPTSFVSPTGETWTMNDAAWDWVTA